jgi:hypothetical protein
MPGTKGEVRCLPLVDINLEYKRKQVLYGIKYYINEN